MQDGRFSKVHRERKDGTVDTEEGVLCFESSWTRFNPSLGLKMRCGVSDTAGGEFM